MVTRGRSYVRAITVKRFLESRGIQAHHVVTALVLLVLLALFLTGCATNTPQNTFDARGEVAKQQRDLFYLAMWPAIVIMVLVLAGLVVIVLRFRRRRPDELPKQTHGNTRLEIAWTIAPVIILAILAVPTVSAIFTLGRQPDRDALAVHVTGRQFFWQFEYPGITDSSGQPLSSLGVMHIPVGREIGLTITSRDVNHSFWVPKLAGKLDAIPGNTNVMWLKADEPGSFSGQCAEFCGLGHAGMKLTVIAQSQEDFDAWIREKGGGPAGGQAASPTPTSGSSGR